MTTDLPDCSTEYLNHQPAQHWPAVSKQQSQVLTSGLADCKVSLSLAVISAEDWERGAALQICKLLFTLFTWLVGQWSPPGPIGLLTTQ